MISHPFAEPRAHGNELVDGVNNQKHSEWARNFAGSGNPSNGFGPGLKAAVSLVLGPEGP